MTDPDAERFPLLSDPGRAMLKRLREHPHAPRYTMGCGNRVTADDLVRLQAFEQFLRETPLDWAEGALPGWLDAHLERAYAQVPAYRRRGPRPARFEDIPTIDRGDLSRAPWDFVPDDAALDGFGAGGAPQVRASDSVVRAAPVGIGLDAGFVARAGLELVWTR